MTEDELCDLEDELDELTDQHFWYYIGSNKTRDGIGWTDEKEIRLEYLQQLLHG